MTLVSPSDPSHLFHPVGIRRRVKTDLKGQFLEKLNQEVMGKIRKELETSRLACDLEDPQMLTCSLAGLHTPHFVLVFEMKYKMKLPEAG